MSIVIQPVVNKTESGRVTFSSTNGTAFWRGEAEGGVKFKERWKGMDAKSSSIPGVITATMAGRA